MLTAGQRHAVFARLDATELLDATPGRIADIADRTMHLAPGLFTGTTKSDVIAFVNEVRARLVAERYAATVA